MAVVSCRRASSLTASRSHGTVTVDQSTAVCRSGLGGVENEFESVSPVPVVVGPRVRVGGAVEESEEAPNVGCAQGVERARVRPMRRHSRSHSPAGRSVRESVIRPSAVSMSTIKKRRRLVLGSSRRGAPWWRRRTGSHRPRSAVAAEVDDLGREVAARGADGLGFEGCPCGEVGGLAGAEPLESSARSTIPRRSAPAEWGRPASTARCCMRRRRRVRRLAAAVSGRFDHLPRRLTPRPVGTRSGERRPLRVESGWESMFLMACLALRWRPHQLLGAAQSVCQIVAGEVDVDVGAGGVRLAKPGSDLSRRPSGLASAVAWVWRSMCGCSPSRPATEPMCSMIW